MDAGISDIPARHSREPRFGEQMSQEGRGGGLAVGAGDAHPKSVFGALPPSQFHFADELGAGGLGASIEAARCRDARTGDAKAESTDYLIGEDDGDARRL